MCVRVRVRVRVCVCALGHPKYDSIKGFTMRGEFPMHITKHMYRAYITDVFTLKKKQGAAVNTTSATW